MSGFSPSSERSGWFVVAAGADTALRVSGTCRTAGADVSGECRVGNAVTGAVLLNKDFRGEADRVRQLAHAVADAIVWAVKRVPGIASTRIAMIGAHSTGKDLYFCDSDGANMVRVKKIS